MNQEDKGDDEKYGKETTAVDETKTNDFSRKTTETKETNLDHSKKTDEKVNYDDDDEHDDLVIEYVPKPYIARDAWEAKSHPSHHDTGRS